MVTIKPMDDADLLKEAYNEIIKSLISIMNRQIRQAYINGMTAGAKQEREFREMLEAIRAQGRQGENEEVQGELDYDASKEDIFEEDESSKGSS